MTQEKLETLRGLCGAATPGPWYSDGWALWDDTLGEFVELHDLSANARFIAAARTALPELLEENETLFAEKLDLLSQLELMRLRAEKAEKENLSRELGSFEEHRDLHYWRDEARKYKARAEAAERLTQHLGACEDCHTAHECLTSSLRADKAAAEAERDAAIEDLKRALFHLEPMQCWYCEHDGTECRSEYICVKPKAGTGVPSGWKWRGQKGGERE